MLRRTTLGRATLRRLPSKLSRQRHPLHSESCSGIAPILRRTTLGWATLEAAPLEVATLEADALQAVQVEAPHHEVGRP